MSRTAKKIKICILCYILYSISLNMNSFKIQIYVDEKVIALHVKLRQRPGREVDLSSPSRVVVMKG